MKFEYEGGALPFLIDRLSYLSITRDAGFANVISKGKGKHALLFTASGKMHYGFSGKYPDITAEEGTVVYLPPKLPYTSTYLVDGTDVRLLLFDIVRGSLPFQKPFSACGSADAQLFLLNDAELTGSTLLAARVYETFSLLTRLPPESTGPRSKILPALQEIRNHYQENRKIAYYADLCHMSQSNFRKLFRDACGRSPIAYRNTLRLMHARSLIESGEYTVEEAAAMTGFQNMSFFYQTCRREFGTSHFKK